MNLPCKNCITLAICKNAGSIETQTYTENEHFSTTLIKKCYILRVWLKSDPKNKKDSLVRYKEFIKFYNINGSYGSSLKSSHLKKILKWQLKRQVVKKILKI